HVNHQSAAASMASRVWASFTSFSLSLRSTTTPAGIDRSSTGNDCAEATSATRKALFESSNASQPCAIDCIHVPMSESVCPNQKSRKLRWRWRVRNGLRERASDEGTLEY